MNSNYDFRPGIFGKFINLSSSKKYSTSSFMSAPDAFKWLRDFKKESSESFVYPNLDFLEDDGRQAKFQAAWDKETHRVQFQCALNNIPTYRQDKHREKLEPVLEELRLKFKARDQFQVMLREIRLYRHKKNIQPALTEVVRIANNRVAIEHSGINFRSIMREDPMATDVTRLFPNDVQVQIDLSDPTSHLSSWGYRWDNRYDGGGLDEFSDSQRAAVYFEELKTQLGYDWSDEVLRENYVRDPNAVWDGSLIQEPYYGDLEEIPFFDDMLGSFADIFVIFN
jgi:hypothetical protein